MKINVFSLSRRQSILRKGVANEANTRGCGIDRERSMIVGRFGKEFVFSAGGVNPFKVAQRMKRTVRNDMATESQRAEE